MLLQSETTTLDDRISKPMMEFENLM
jgi:hypothetical protein